MNSLVWKPDTMLVNNKPSEDLLPWLRHRASLTAKLRAEYGQIDIKIARQGICPLTTAEGLLVHSPFAQGYVREVIMSAGNVPLICARTVLSLKSVSDSFSTVKSLGSRHLGRLLFHREIKRSPFEFTYLQPTQIKTVFSAPVYDTVILMPIWGRRSIFTRNHQPLLLTEFFMPGVYEK